MITAVAFCPQAPALVPEIGVGLDPELGPLRAECRDAVRRVSRDGARLEVIGADVTPDVRDWLIGDAVVVTADPTALLVVGDGSARRTEKAPGYLDERAAGFDRDVAGALCSGDPDRLAALNAELGRDLLAAGVPAWHEAAVRLAGARFDAVVSYDDAPFGVGYFVAVWARAQH